MPEFSSTVLPALSLYSQKQTKTNVGRKVPCQSGRRNQNYRRTDGLQRPALLGRLCQRVDLTSKHVSNINIQKMSTSKRHVKYIRTSVMKKLSAGGSSRGCRSGDWLLPATHAELGRARGRLLMVLVSSSSAAASVRELLLCIGGSGEHLTSELQLMDADFDLWPDLLTGGLADFGGAASMARSRSSTLQRGINGTEFDTYNIHRLYYFTLSASDGSKSDSDDSSD